MFTSFCCAIILCALAILASVTKRTKEKTEETTLYFCELEHTPTKMDNRLDIESLDKLFKPSCWSKRYSTPEQVLSEHIAFAKSGKNFQFFVVFFLCFALHSSAPKHKTIQTITMYTKRHWQIFGCTLHAIDRFPMLHITMCWCDAEECVLLCYICILREKNKVSCTIRSKPTEFFGWTLGNTFIGATFLRNQS